MHDERIQIVDDEIQDLLERWKIIFNVRTYESEFIPDFIISGFILAK